LRSDAIGQSQTGSPVHEATGSPHLDLAPEIRARIHNLQSHSQRVSEYAVHLGRVMGLDSESLHTLRQAALLHDIGKIGIPEAVLRKPGKLTAAEWSLVRRHPEVGWAILQGLDGLAPAAELVLSHHERFDGTGYPQGAKGDQIPFGASLIAVADSLDAQISGRPYRRAVTLAAAQQEIERCSGTHFDPLVVRFFLQVPRKQWIRAPLGEAASAVLPDFPGAVIGASRETGRSVADRLIGIVSAY